MTMLKDFMHICLIIILLIASYQDIKDQHIKIKILFMVGLISIFKLLLSVGGNNYLLIVPVLIAGAVLFIADKKGIRILGGADVIVIVAMTCLLRVITFFVAMCVAFLGAFVISIVLLLIGRIHKDDTLPFIPFLTVGAIVALVMEKLYA